MRRKEMIKRYLFFLLGLFVNSFGIAFITKADLGTSPITSVPYTLSLAFSPSLGMFTLFMSIILVILQLIILGKRFPLHYFLQIPTSFLFSYFIDFSMSLLGAMKPENYGMKLLSLLAGCLILGFGVYMEMAANVVMLPGESFISALTMRFKVDFGKTKVVFDSSCVALAIILSLILFRQLKGVREGTIIAALLVGFIARIFKHKLAFIEERFLKTPEGALVKEVPEAGAVRGPVIAISREYGSGGRRIAAGLAEALGLTFHDRDIIRVMARRLNLPDRVVEDSEQKLNNTLLYDLLAQFYEFSENMPEKDRLYEEEKKLVREYAAAGSCVILGRCSNITLKDYPNVFRLFLYADEDYKTRELMRRDGLSREAAEKKMREINHERATHYKYYTGREWGDARNYDLCVNVSRFTEDQIIDMVREGMRRIKPN